MNQTPDKILSASRRTDIPAFYMSWFMDQIKSGFFNVKNPYNKSIRKIDVSSDLIHSIVFWSKNYDEFIRTKSGNKLLQRGYNLYFNFTINSESSLLEPDIPPLKKRFEQLKTLADTFGPNTISWRFDPICFYKTDNDTLENNLSDFSKICQQASKLGIKKCVTSFFDDYRKIAKRIEFISKKYHRPIRFIEPSIDKQRKVIRRMEKHLNSAGINLYLCCEKQLFATLANDTTVQQNSCVDGNLLKNLFSGNPDTKKDYGQRAKLGCKCTKSIDIGSYDLHPCFHNCLFCYANPDIDNKITKTM